MDGDSLARFEISIEWSVAILKPMARNFEIEAGLVTVLQLVLGGL